MGKKVLVIGSGPSGIFTCGALSSDSSIDVKVWVTLIRMHTLGFLRSGQL